MRPIIKAAKIRDTVESLVANSETMQGVAVDSPFVREVARRIAELRKNGERANVRVTWNRAADNSFVHRVYVRREDGSIEPPSGIQ